MAVSPYKGDRAVLFMSMSLPTWVARGWQESLPLLPGPGRAGLEIVQAYWLICASGLRQ